MLHARHDRHEPGTCDRLGGGIDNGGERVAGKPLKMFVDESAYTHRLGAGDVPPGARERVLRQRSERTKADADDEPGDEYDTKVRRRVSTQAAHQANANGSTTRFKPRLRLRRCFDVDHTAVLEFAARRRLPEEHVL
jgi:hypothetical protein